MEQAILLDLLAQGQNFEEWGDVLVIAIMAILWLAGAAAKVLTSRKGTQRQRPQEAQADQQTRKRESWHERLARKAQEIQRAAEAKGRQLEQQARAHTQTAKPRPAPAAEQPSPPAGKVTIRTDQKGDSVLVYERPTTERERQAARQREVRKAVLAAGHQTAKSPSVEPRVEPDYFGYEPGIGGMTTAAREPIESLEPGAERSQPAGGLHPAAIIDYSDPDALRKAILHYEILGKPLALRKPADEAISF